MEFKNFTYFTSTKADCVIEGEGEDTIFNGTRTTVTLDKDGKLKVEKTTYGQNGPDANFVFLMKKTFSPDISKDVFDKYYYGIVTKAIKGRADKVEKGEKRSEFLNETKTSFQRIKNDALKNAVNKELKDRIIQRANKIETFLNETILENS